MCGIVGIHSFGEKTPISQETLGRMTGMLRHRGPDQYGMYLDPHVGLGHVRLSIIDLATGVQPIHNEDETLWIVYNGEVYNYVELRERLEAKGHRFYTNTDTEVILHLYEDEGPSLLERLNGQFAFALWDSKKGELMLARDRVGIRPLYYTVVAGTLIFASEIKAIFANERVPRRMDPIGLDQIFTFWTTLTPRTAFENIWNVPPGHYLLSRSTHVAVRKYWDIPLPQSKDLWCEPPGVLCTRVQELLHDAVRIRLRADVPVGCYLSGGLDSSVLATLMANGFNSEVHTFGIRFQDPDFDESQFQNQMVSFLNVDHNEVQATNGDIGRVFEDVIWHCEKPILRTSPAPLYLLSNLVSQSGFKVVLSGEGADEVFGGYNIFREAKLRRFWARAPASEWRAGLLGQLYPYVFRTAHQRAPLRLFFGKGLDRTDDSIFSHRLRWDNTGRLKRFFSDELRCAVGSYDAYDQICDNLPPDFLQADGLSRAQYLEMGIFLSNYLLSCQGDRMAMAHSVEIRLPYLDYRIIEFMARVPARWKILGLKEKHILRKCFRGVLPDIITERRKHPYRAPIDKSLLSGPTAARTAEILSDESMRTAGLFDPQKVTRLLTKLKAAQNLTEMDNMALAGILSSQIVYDQFVQHFDKRDGVSVKPDLVVDRRNGEYEARLSHMQNTMGGRCRNDRI